MTMKTRVLAALGAVAVTLLIAVVAIVAGPGGASAARGNTSAQQTTTTTTTASATTRTGTSTGTTTGARSATDKCDNGYAAKLAANLGVTEDALEAAVKKTAVQEIDEAEKNGRLTADQAKAARDHINNSADGFPCIGFGAIGIGGPGHGFGGRGGDGDGPSMGGPMFGFGDYYETAATYLGISQDQFRQELKDLGSLKAVTEKYADKGKNEAGLKGAIEAKLRQDLAGRGLTADQVTQIVDQFTRSFNQIYSAQIGQHDGPWMPGKGGGRAPRQAPTGSQ